MKQLMAGLCLCALGCTRPVVNAVASVPADAGQRAAVVALPPVDAGSPPHDAIVRFVAIGDTGKGNADKATIVAAMQALGFHPADDNEADALALLRWAVAQHPKPEGDSNG